MSEKDEGKAFIEEIIADVKTAKELSETEKNELIAIALEAWKSEQEE
jgi:hypothetical protein